MSLSLSFPLKRGVEAIGAAPWTLPALYLLGIQKDGVLPAPLFPLECGHPDLSGQRNVGGSDGSFQVEAFRSTWSRNRGGLPFRPGAGGAPGQSERE